MMPTIGEISSALSEVVFERFYENYVELLHVTRSFVLRTSLGLERYDHSYLGMMRHLCLY